MSVEKERWASKKETHAYRDEVAETTVREIER